MHQPGKNKVYYVNAFLLEMRRLHKSKVLCICNIQYAVIHCSIFPCL